MNKIPMALTSAAIPHLMGYQATKSGEKYAQPLGAVGFMDAAVEVGLSGVDMGIPFRDTAALDEFQAALQDRDLRLVVELDVVSRYDVAELRRCIEAVSKLDANVMRVMISGILCGDRRSIDGGWESVMAETADRLRAVLPIAEDLGVCIAVENHQDATSDDLIRLGDMCGNSSAYGVTLDAGNPLAVGEDPVEFAGRISHLLRHIHMKDYTIHFAPNGFRLVRCAAGEGVVNFPGLLAIVRGNGRDVLPGLEIGAQATRTIPVLELDWWDHYPDVLANQFVPALKILWAKGRPQDEPYSSAWERGEDSAAVAAEEWSVLRRSAAYFRTLHGAS